MGFIKSLIFTIVFIICMFGFLYWVLDEEDKITRCIAENKEAPCVEEMCMVRHQFFYSRAIKEYKVCLEEINKK